MGDDLAKTRKNERMGYPFDLNAFRLVYDSNPQAFCIVHVVKEKNVIHDFLFVYANLAYGKMFGISLQKLIGHTYTDIFGEPNEQWNRIYGDIAYGGGAKRLIVPGSDKNAYVSVQCFQVAPEYCGSNVLDVTEEMKEIRKAKEESKQNLKRVRSERALYQSILDTTEDMVTVIDAETYEIIYANASAQNVTKDMLGGYVGSTCYRSIKQCDEPCKDCMLFRTDHESEETRDLLYGDKIYRMTYKIMTWNGRRVLLEYSSDVTALREKERVFQQQVDFIVNLDWDNLIAKGRYNLTQNKPIKVVGKNVDAIVSTPNEKYDALIIQLANTAITQNKRKELLDALDRRKLLEGYALGKRELSLNYRRRFSNEEVCWVTLKGALYQEPETKDIIAFYYTYDNTHQILQSMVTQKLSTSMYLHLGIIDVESKKCKMLKDNAEDTKAGLNFDYERIVRDKCKTAVVIGDYDKLMEELSYDRVVENLSQKESYIVDYSKIGPKGTLQRVSLRYCYLNEDKDTILYYSTDITESYEQDQKQLKEIQDALHQAEVSNRAKTDFLSRMSHDMRTPMNGVLGVVTLLLDEEIPEKVRDGLFQIQYSGEYLLNLINDTLDVNKIEANRLELHCKATDVYKLAENVKINAKMLAAEKGVQFEMIKINPEQITQTVLLMDEARTEQLFMNLVSNAIKFTPEGGHVWLTMERLETTEDYVLNRYQFKDTGIGMSQEFLHHIYEPFSQEGRINTSRESGTGLGMAIVFQIVKLMGATITVESEMNVGTTFTLTIRFERFKGIFNEPKMGQHKEENLNGKHVLLCEDHPLNRQIAEKLLAKKGMLVDSAEDGAQGCELFEKSPENYYDLVLMDIRMPKMNGFEATKAIRALNRNDANTVTIIAMTANAFDDDVKDCMAAGMNAHISKPIEVDKMYQTILAYLS